MQYREGASVVTSDDHHVGDIARVVIDPHTREVTDIIVREGFLFTEDRILPTDLIATTSDDTVRLNVTKDALPDLRPLVEQHFIPADDLAEDEALAAPGVAAPLYGYPPAGMGWWGGGYSTYWPAQPVNVETESNLPEGSVVLNQGARVTSADGEHVGDIDEVITDGTDGVATHFVIAEGFLFKERKIIPTGWIQKVRTDDVLLSVRAKVLERLPAYDG